MTRVALACLLTVAAAARDVAAPMADVVPRGRNKPAFAFDPTRKSLVLFGGFGDRAAVLHDAWERTDDGWRQVESSAFPPRAAAGVATDTRRGRVVLFGGDDEAGVCGDTLEWDGKAWKRVAWSGPPARTVPQLAYDSKRDRTVLFGGSDGKQTTFGDTWEWDGTQWTKRADSGPPPRYQHVMTYDAARGRVVLFGGHPGGPYDAASWSQRVLGDTWEWDGARWTPAAGAGPSARDHHAMTYDESRAKVVLHGGWGAKGPETDTWRWDGRTWTRAE